MPVVSLCSLTDSADGCAASRLRTVQPQSFAVLTAHQWLEALFDHGVEFTALQLSGRQQMMIFSQLDLP